MVTLNWLMSFIMNKTFPLIYETSTLSLKILCTGVPRYSVLFPLIFLIYIKPISDIIVKFSVKYHIYADDILIYKSYNNLGLVNTNNNPLSICANAIHHWLLTNTLFLNESKTELLNIPNYFVNFPYIILDGTVVTASKSITYHGIEIDCDLRLKYQITSVLKKVNFSLHQIRNIRRFINMTTTIILIKPLELNYDLLNQCKSNHHFLKLLMAKSIVVYNKTKNS